MKNRTENISVRYRPQHLTKSRIFKALFYTGKLMVKVVP